MVEKIDQELCQDLLQYYEANDLNSFKNFCEKFQKIALRVAFMIHKNEPDAYDTVQQVIFSIIRSQAKCKGVYTGNVNEVKSWLFSIVYNTARQQMKKEKRMSPIAENFEVEDKSFEDENHHEKDDRFELIKTVLLDIPEKYRMPIILRYKEEMSISEISSMLSQKQATIRSLISRGIEKIRNQLASTGVKVSSIALIALISKEQFCTAATVVNTSNMEGLVTEAMKAKSQVMVSASVGSSSSSYQALYFLISFLLITGGTYLAYENYHLENNQAVVEKVFPSERIEKTKWNFSHDSGSDLVVIQGEYQITPGGKFPKALFSDYMKIPAMIKFPVKLTPPFQVSLDSDLSLKNLESNAVEGVLLNDDKVIAGKMLFHRVGEIPNTSIPKNADRIKMRTTFYIFDNYLYVKSEENNGIKCFYYPFKNQMDFALLIRNFYVYEIAFSSLKDEDVAKLTQEIKKNLNQKK